MLAKQDFAQITTLVRKEIATALEDVVNPRFDALESDVSELKTDVSQLKTDVALLKLDTSELREWLLNVILVDN